MDGICVIFSYAHAKGLVPCCFHVVGYGVLRKDPHILQDILDTIHNHNKIDAARVPPAARGYKRGWTGVSLSVQSWSAAPN